MRILFLLCAFAPLWLNAQTGLRSPAFVASLQRSGSGDISTGLKVHIEFEEGSGTTAADSSGNGHTGTLVGPAWVTGQLGSGAIEVDTDDEHVTFVDGADFSPGAGDFTVAFWFKTATLDAANRVIAANFGTGDNVWFVRLTTGDKFQVWFRDTDGDDVLSTSTVTLSSTTWYRVVASREGTSGHIRVKPAVGSFTTDTDTDGALGTITASGGTVPVLMKHNNPDGSFGRGVIDDYRIYDRALSLDDANALP